MDERSMVETAFEDGGVLDGVRWAQWSTNNHALTVYEPEAGHDRAFLGQLRFTVLRDRLDRVFQCRQYQSPEPGSGVEGVGGDVVAVSLPRNESLRMPKIPHGQVVRDGLNGSPGWRYRRFRFLLSSFRFGEIDQIQWSRKSKTKQAVASSPDPEQLGFDFDPANGLFLPDEPAVASVEVQTYVVAHALDPDSGGSQLFLGRSCYDRQHGSWYWRFAVNGLPPQDSGRGATPTTPDPVDPNRDSSTGAEDVALSLRKDTKDGRG